MISNEWEEYLAYTQTPEYFVNDKKSYPFLGRFTLNMIPKNNGFNRILTILARRYLFHNPDGTLKAGDPYDRTEYARRAYVPGAVFRTAKKPPVKSGNTQVISENCTPVFPIWSVRTATDGTHGIFTMPQILSVKT